MLISSMISIDVMRVNLMIVMLCWVCWCDGGKWCVFMIFVLLW